MSTCSPPRNSVRPAAASGSRVPAGRHARPLSPPAGALSDVLRDRSFERIRAADRAVADALARIRGTGADSDAVRGAFAVVRGSLREARETVREARRELALVIHEWERLNRELGQPSRYPEAAAPVVPDPPGRDLCPDPGGAHTPVQFIDTLRAYRKWAGSPSYRAMEHAIRNQPGRSFSASALHAALKGSSLPALPKVQAIIAACGGTEAHQQAFTTAWRHLAIVRQDAAPPRPHGPAGEAAPRETGQ
jgi:hypothetical protein